ncbi:hypothetical protein BJ875DRAFT_195122 [Amylocarpus encephaloides]|uniref:Uncharacterized protein n=1 Tax=Amylocarpus encephaloides TaxID=45428 RepID=A0A9P7YNR0_9HELO|nr:hypothetical protein BJ875DRAFT_195122 [Amylocarpus encephaloides]
MMRSIRILGRRGQCARESQTSQVARCRMLTGGWRLELPRRGPQQATCFAVATITTKADESKAEATRSKRRRTRQRQERYYVTTAEMQPEDRQPEGTSPTQEHSPISPPGIGYIVIPTYTEYIRDIYVCIYIQESGCTACTALCVRALCSDSNVSWILWGRLRYGGVPESGLGSVSHDSLFHLGPTSQASWLCTQSSPWPFSRSISPLLPSTDASTQPPFNMDRPSYYVLSKVLRSTVT